MPAQGSKLLVYLSIHGGEYFIKFRTKSVILTQEANRTLWEAFYKGRFSEIVFILDTCEAFSLFDAVTVPNIYFVGSSLIDQKAKSHHFDPIALNASSDRFTFTLSKELKDIYARKDYTSNLKYLFEKIRNKKQFLETDVGILDRINRRIEFRDFFGSSDEVHVKEGKLIENVKLDWTNVRLRQDSLMKMEKV